MIHTIHYTIIAIALAATLPVPALAADKAATSTPAVNVHVDEPSMKQRMADCMAIWEPRTHMTKAEWRKTCVSSLKDLPNL
jgi:hypothetical protein